MKITSFWVVTKPTAGDSTLRDILFKANWKRMKLQFLGGLDDKYSRILGVWTYKSEAEKVARKELKRFRSKRPNI